MMRRYLPKEPVEIVVLVELLDDVMDDQLFTDKADSYYAMNKDVKKSVRFCFQSDE